MSGKAAAMVELNSWRSMSAGGGEGGKSQTSQPLSVSVTATAHSTHGLLSAASGTSQAASLHHNTVPCPSGAACDGSRLSLGVLSAVRILACMQRCPGGFGLTRDQAGGQVAHIHLALRLAGGRHRGKRLLLQHQLPRAQLLLLHLPRDCKQHERVAT